MIAPELAVIALNTALALVAYLSVYPTLAGNNIHKIALYDLLTSCIALGIVGYHYWGSDYQFNLVISEVNWFWFTLTSYAVIEVPLMLWYFKKHEVKFK